MLLAHYDTQTATSCPPDFITLMAVQTTATGRRRVTRGSLRKANPDHPDAGSSIVLIEQNVKGRWPARAVGFDDHRGHLTVTPPVQPSLPV
jgi:hypothetical protein